ncbi:MoaD/ThiS family protein [Rhizohabitans arisaemae]|uniref:MoaD/ThiS family protein n=1 Tax=Rhizohabitans arisaemae TaxID=2720610 RepID=UPI0024B061BE|nr:MoaD/ThiS family protein [Rhizohabitans arisaemae]
MRRGTIRYWAAAKDAAGVAEEPFAADTLAEVLAEAVRRHADSPEFSRVLRRSSILIDGDPVGLRAPADIMVKDGATVEVLPPFAGG